MEHSTHALGRATKTQNSINVQINEKEIFDLLINNKEKINEILKTNKNKFIEEFWSFFLERKNFIFPLSKQNEIYIKYHKSDIEHIFRYINFRYLFYLTSSKKINIGYPPYLLIEPVSACNLRCPFCFQVDKTFTRKPFMGVIDLSLFKKVIDEADLLGVGAVTIASRGEPTLHKNLKDTTHLKSWFRDQVLHPYETQFSIKEVIDILDKENFHARARPAPVSHITNQ